MGGLTLWLTQQFVSSPSIKYWLVPKLHPSTTSGVLWILLWIVTHFSIEPRSTVHHKLGGCINITLLLVALISFYICSNGSSDK